MASSEILNRAEAGDVRAQVQAAEALDDEGRHAEAIDWLSRAARSGDPEALTLLGLRLVTGRDAPFLPADGVRLLGDAASAGGAEAAGHLAVLIGAGFFMNQSWPAALDCLQRSAELGSDSAQAQLRILAGVSTDEQPGGPGMWASLRQAIDLGTWLNPGPSRRTLSEAPLVVAFDGLIPAAACDWIAEQSRPKLVRAEIYGAAHGGGVTDGTRTNTTANFALAETTLLNVLLQGRIAAAAGAPLTHLEAFNVLHYTVGEAFIDHVDYLDVTNAAYAQEIAQRGQRAATVLVYLNDDYEGGTTEFPRLDISIKGRRGDALLFANVVADGAPDPRSMHAGRTPTSGEKWMLTQFIRSRPQFGPAG